MAKAQIKKSPPVLENKKARFQYEIMETVEAGIVLTGTEVKSLREGGGNLADSYALPRGGELFLVNLRIQPYQNAGAFNHAEDRTRKLLLKRTEIARFESRIKEKRLTMIPLKLYFNEKGLVKVLLGLGRGKKIADRRESEKKREADREMARALRNHG